MNIILAKTTISVAATFAWGTVYVGTRSSARSAIAWLNVPVAWTLTRLMPWFIIYVVAGFTPQSDVATAFWPQADAVLHGQIPYRDFECFFSPLFPYWTALPLLIWKDPRSLVLFLSILEAVAVALTFPPQKQTEEKYDRPRVLALYYIAPGPLLLAVVGGQEDFLFWLAAILLWKLIVQCRHFTAGCCVVLATLLTKPTFFIPAAIMFGLCQRRWRFLAGSVPIALGVLAGLWWLTGTAFLNVLSQGDNISPPNLWIWAHWWSGGLFSLSHRGLSVGMLLISAAAGAALFKRYAKIIVERFSAFSAAWMVSFSILMLISLKSLGAYFGYFSLPALALFIRTDDRRALIAWLLMGAIAPIECSLWFRLGEPLITSWPSGWQVGVEYSLQGLMLACLIYFCVVGLRHLRQKPASC